MSGGIVKMKPAKDKDEVPVLLLKMIISNQESDATWTVDPQSQFISYPNYDGKIAPVYAQSDMAMSPTLVINRGEMRTLNLYFRLPENRKSESEIPEFDFRWQVRAGDRPVEVTTSFDRITIEPYAVGPWPYYYPYYYPHYDSPAFWPYFTFGFDYGWDPSPSMVSPPVPVAPPSEPLIVGH
jgi:hypothetical protein